MSGATATTDSANLDAELFDRDQGGEQSGGEQQTTTGDSEQQAMGAPPAPSADQPHDGGGDKPTDQETQTIVDSQATGETWTKKAALEERRKRQEAEARSTQTERELFEARARLEALERAFGGHPQQQAQKKGFYDDPEGALHSTAESLRAEFKQSLYDQTSAVMRMQHSDFNEAEKAFAEAAKNNQHLVAQFRSHPHPAIFAYETGKTYLQASKYGGSFDEMRAKMRADVEKEVRAELELESRKRASDEAASQATTSVAQARGSGGTSMPAFSGHTPDDEIFTNNPL